MYKLGSVPVQDEREQHILRFAFELINGVNPTGELTPIGEYVPLDEATIDAGFLFRFDPAWRRWVRKIRGMIQALLGQMGDEPLSTEDGTLVLCHLRNNPKISIRGTSRPDGGSITITTATPNGGYRCLSSELEAVREAAIRQAIRGDLPELDRLRPKILAEAIQTSKIQGELKRLMLAYNFIPHEHERGNYTPNEMGWMYDTVVNYVICGSIEQLWFRWPRTRLIENKTGNGLERSIRPYKWERGTFFERGGIREWTVGQWHDRERGGRIFVEDNPEPPKRMTTLVRVRTWAVYYLTRRGGGKRTEQSAVDLWNEVFSDSPVDVRNFRAERKRLFEGGALKSA